MSLLESEVFFTVLFEPLGVTLPYWFDIVVFMDLKHSDEESVDVLVILKVDRIRPPSYNSVAKYAPTASLNAKTSCFIAICFARSSLVWLPGSVPISLLSSANNFNVLY